MNPRTRAVLSALGVPVWAARQRVVQTITPNPVWRDQTEHIEIKPTAPPGPQQPRRGQGGHLALGQQPTITKAPPAPIPVVVPQTPSLPQQQGVKPSAVESSASVIRFAVEALLLKSWILVVPAQQLEDTACRQLWEQLQVVFASTPVAWSWPLAEGVRWQTAPYAAVALQGLFARLQPHARVGLMGELPDQVLPDRVERLPSLVNLIEQPLHKRTLWQLLQTELTASLPQ